MARPKGDIDQRILHAARARFLAEGVDGASLRAVAKDARTSIGMIYYYFPTKDELFFGVVEEVYQRVLRDIEIALAPDVDIEARIRRLYERIVRLDDDERDVLRLVVRESLTSAARRERLLERFARGHFPIVIRTVLEGFANGALDASLPPFVVATAIISLGALPPVAHRIVGGHLPLPGPKSPEDLPAELVRTLFSGIGAKAPTLTGSPYRTPARSPPKSGHPRAGIKGHRRKKTPSGG
jgi:AcrR family transcriptional regulator